MRRQLSKSTFNARDTFNRKTLTPNEYLAWKNSKKKTKKKAAKKTDGAGSPSRNEVTVSRRHMPRETITSDDGTSSSSSGEGPRAKKKNSKSDKGDETAKINTDSKSDREDDESSSSETKEYSIVAADSEQSDASLLAESPVKRA